jgi:hypothetical protein
MAIHLTLPDELTPISLNRPKAPNTLDFAVLPDLVSTRSR